MTDKEMIKTDMKPGNISDERLWDIIKRCELSEEEEIKGKVHGRLNKLIREIDDMSKI